MAGAKSGVHVVQLKPISVPISLQTGNKFVKWDDDSTVGTPVTLKVDKRGFFLYWTDQNKETEFLEVSSIRDTRTSRFARVPKEGKLRDSVTMGAPDTPLEDKTLTVVYGPDMVNISIINFCCNCRETAQEWAEAILEMSYNLLSLNSASTVYLEKAFTKLHLMRDREGRIPVKNVLKMFSQHKDDRKRVEKALNQCGFPTSKNDALQPEKFTFDTFLVFYKHLVCREEINAIYEAACGGKKKGMTVDQLVEFLNKEQRDPRLNEILYPYANPARARDIIRQYEPNKTMAQKGLMSIDGFLRYLMSDDNTIVSPEKFDLNQDMDQSLSHYFINSSHNTYLTGHQLTGKSSVEIYRQCLLAGCRCVELDCWNGKNSDEEPIITHGYTVVTDILLKDVLEAIADSAFKTSAYPVVLSFENHCSPRQQVKIAQYCHKIFGERLLTEPLSTHPLKPNQPLPSPNQLLKKIIIKNKKKHSSRSEHATSQTELSVQKTAAPEGKEKHPHPKLEPASSSEEAPEPPPEAMDDPPKSLSCDLEETDSESAASEDEEPVEKSEGDQNEGTAAKESEAGAEMSALVNYIQPVRFHTFEHSEKRSRSYEISSFVETQATNLLKEHPVEFVNYNKRQLSRVYPRGTRVDSSNYTPQVFWNAGCQMVALNYQTLDLGMQLNLGIFEYNGRSGYLLKPDFMRRAGRKFDPFTESTVDGIIAGTVTVKIISGQFLTDRRVGTYVEVDMYGLPADTVRRKFRTKTVPNNAINPLYDEEPFIFKKVVLPDLAVLRIAVYEENGRFIGHRILPVVGLRPGYRHISLRNESGQALCLPTLFVHITVKDYIPDGFSELANALANPIAYQSMVEKHAQQLMALTDDIDISEDAGGEVGAQHPPSKAAPTKSPVAEDKPKQHPPETGSEPTDHNNMNGSVQKPAAPTSPGPAPATALNRQDTLGKRLNQSVRSLSDDNSQEKPPSLLESEEANLTAESLEQLWEHRLVLKVLAKMNKELQALQKKHEKLKEKEREVQHQKEDKLSKYQLQQRNQLSKTQSKSSKKNPGDTQLMKRKSEAEIVALSAEHQSKLEELQRCHTESLVSLRKDLYRAEKELQEKYQEPLFTALEKAMKLSQEAQMDHLKSLHDREVSELMKRLETQNKEDMKNLSKKHKDKNELARIKRELHQKLIEQAVSERQRFSSLLDKRKRELELQHNDVRKKLEDDKAAGLLTGKLRTKKREESGEDGVSSENSTEEEDTGSFNSEWLEKALEASTTINRDPKFKFCCF